MKKYANEKLIFVILRIRLSSMLLNSSCIYLQIKDKKIKKYFSNL